MFGDGIEVTGCKNGDLKVERYLMGVMVDKFIVAPGGTTKKSGKWIAPALELIQQPPAGVIIEQPEMPARQTTQVERLVVLTERVLELEARLMVSSMRDLSVKENRNYVDALAKVEAGVLPSSDLVPMLENSKEESNA